jgi:hypothetical protein
VDDEDFSEHLAPWGALEALPGCAMSATERTHKRQAWPGGQSRRVLGVRGALLGPRHARLELQG